MSRKRSSSSARWLAEHEADPYVKEARRLGYRSRAVFKLEEIHQRDRLFRAGQVVVDLGAAPGGWSQWARPLLGAKGALVALDILPMEPLAGVEVITGDFREDSVLETLQSVVGGRAVDLVMSDMAPNVSGVDVTDQAGQIYLCELARDFALEQLRPGGDLLAKVFQGDGFDDFLKSLRQAFEKVVVRKPKASRGRSREVYLLARGLRRV